MVQGDVEAIVDVDDALLLHTCEDDGSLNVFTSRFFCLTEVLLKPAKLSQLSLRVVSLLLLIEVFLSLLLGGPSALLTTMERKVR